MIQPLYPDAVTSKPQYSIGHVAVHSAGISYRCWVCSSECGSLIKVADGDWRCGECIPDNMKPASKRSHHGNRVANAVRHCAPALAIWMAVTSDGGLQEVPRLPFRN